MTAGAGRAGDASGVRARSGTRVPTAAPLARVTMAAKQFTREEVQASDAKTNNLFIIKNKVYDVFKFLDEHPGGHEVLVKVTGKDATEDFEDVGHGLDAKEIMKKYQIGELVAEDRRESGNARQVNWAATATADEESKVGFMSSWKFPVLLGILVTVAYSYLFG